MDDMIYRQAAIDAFEGELYSLSLFEKIQNLPSAQPKTKCIAEIKISKKDMEKLVSEKIDEIKAAQPDVPDTNVGEIISILSDIRNKYNCFDATERPYYHALSEAINALSEQPEIIRCRNCVYGEQDVDGWWFCNDLGCQIGDRDGSGFCADAERRTDE